jgi:alpha-D-ribose 1-methylphosphonate 5-triphosphate synthase subunit PhnL
MDVRTPLTKKSLDTLCSNALGWNTEPVIARVNSLVASVNALPFARSLVNKPRLILADEPTGNLDTKNRDRIMDLFGSLLDEGITLALVTHDDVVAQYAQRLHPYAGWQNSGG